jgi:hypothetical protein
MAKEKTPEEIERLRAFFSRKWNEDDLRAVLKMAAEDMDEDQKIPPRERQS